MTAAYPATKAVAPSSPQRARRRPGVRSPGTRKQGTCNQRTRSPETRNQGFSLLETQVALAIIAVAALSGALSMANFAGDKRGRWALEDFVGQLQATRSEAIGSGRALTLCPLGEEGSCGTDWRLGIAVLAGDQPLRRHEFSGALATIRMNSLLTIPRVRFDPEGMISLGTSFLICAANGQSARVVLNRGGRIRVEGDLWSGRQGAINDACN